MSTEVTKQPSFEDVIINKLRKDIGELMPDDALKAILERATQHIFFDPVKTPRTYGGYDVAPYSWLEKTCKDLLTERMEKMIKEYMASNPDVVKKALDDALSAGIVNAFARSFDSMLQQATYDLQNRIVTTLTSR